MTFILPLLLCVLLFAVLALLFNAGMWNNAITFINAVTAGLLAMNYFEPLADWLDSQVSWLTYIWDFTALWVLFITFMIILRTLTGFASGVKVRFLEIADRIGSLVFAVLVGAVLVCFTLTTLHTAPLAKNFLFGGFRPTEPMLFFMSPDSNWLDFMQRQSRGSFSRALGDGERAKYGGQEEVAVFDAGNRFMATYTARRSALEKNIASGKGISPEAGKAPAR